MPNQSRNRPSPRGFSRNRNLVKCQDCGFLAIRDPDDQGFVAPSVHYRSEGFQGSPKHLWPHVQPMPNCFVREHPIHNEPLVVEGRAVGQMMGEAPVILESATEKVVTALRKPSYSSSGRSAIVKRSTVGLLGFPPENTMR